MKTIHYSRYFQSGQRIVLKRASESVRDGQFDSVSGVLLDCGDNYFDIKIAYGSEYPFFSGMPFELFSDYYGLGLSLTVHYESTPDAGKFRFSPQGNLEFFFQRQYLRAEMMLWVGYRRGVGDLKTLRRQWKRHAERCVSGLEPANLPPIQRMSLSLGGGGLGMTLTAPVHPAELCLIYLALEDGGRLVCVLAEIVSIRKTEVAGLQAAGMRFLNILEEDRKRIIMAVRRLHRESREENS